MLTRLRQHLKDTEYWSDCIAVISKDNLLNKTHVKYFENKFHSFAKDAGRSIVLNILHAADIACLQQFTDFCSVLIFFRSAIFSGHIKTSNVALLFYTTSEVYIKLGIGPKECCQIVATERFNI